MEIDANFAYLKDTILENLTREEGKYIELSKEIAKDVESRKITIVDVIKRLECLLLSQSFSKRDLGVLLLSETLLSLKDGTLNPEQLSVLSAYFCEKLKDHHQVATSALRGTLALISFTNTPSDSIIQLVSHIFNHITCQQQQQQHRYLIFQIYETVLEKHLNEVNSMSIDFVYGVISSVDGERDPKNLLYLFSWLQVFLKTVKLGHLTEEMFDVLSCYFPVDFKAPSDKIQITRGDLAQGLCKCLTSIADFGQYGIPLALEKLESALKIAKEDSLDLLQSGCKNYSPEIYYQHSIETWSALQKEIFNTSDEQFRLKCLETLKEVVTKLSQGDQKNFENTILDIADTLKGNVLPDSKLFLQSSQILVYVARASALSSVLIAKKVTPLLENTFKITLNAHHKALILCTFIGFVKAIIETNVEVDLSGMEEISSCPSLCAQAILDKEPDLIIAGYEGFTAIARFIPENVRCMYLQNIGEALITPLESNVRYAILRSLEKIAEIYPREVEEHTLHKDIICDITTVDNYLGGLSSIVKLPYFQDYAIDTFISYATANVNSSTVALEHLNRILSNIIDVNELLLKREFVTRLLDFLVALNTIDQPSNRFFGGINTILQNIMRRQDASSQKSIYLTHSSRSFQNEDIYLVILSGLIVPLRRGVFEDYDKINYLLHNGLNATNNDFVRSMSLEVLANVLNKIDNAQVLEEKLNTIRTSCDNCNSETKVWLISWTIKGLVTRNHPQALQWADLLLNCLKDHKDAAKGFRIIMDENYRVISKENYCQIMPLYKQKFFIYCTNKLNEVAHTDCAEYLNAVGYLIENAPKLAIIGHFQKIFRLVLLCLEKCTEPSVLDILLQRIREFVVGGESVIEDNLEDILLRVLKLTQFNASMIVRIAAIRCVHQMTITYKVYKLLPYKSEVIRQLGVCVDDSKRLVRREAMECRSLWYLLDAPE